MRFFRQRTQKPFGFALIVTLAMMMLLMVLILGILGMSRFEGKGANTINLGKRTDNLRNSAINLVMAQIRSGSKSRDANNAAVLWASQPGAIRTWDLNGQFSKGYRLYSSPQMVHATTQEDDFSRPDAALQAWSDDPARFCDLNQPVLRSVGGVKKVYYPIIDPRCLTDGGTALPKVEGFVFRTDEFKDTVLPTNSTDDKGRLPMPVYWLYVLEDGTLGTLAADGRFVGPISPTVDNPIVGRVAFWADDDTCKLNVNTASDPTPWDTPRLISKEDLDYGKFQPGLNEFQRYSGHPYTVSLAPVFFSGIPFSREHLYRELPKVEPGGSQSGASMGSMIVPDNQRLFANAQEMRFLPTMDGDKRARSSLFHVATLERSDAFLTSQGTSCETNVFGLPRISIWPVETNSTNWTAMDQLFALFSSLGPMPYYFQRQNSKSPTQDMANILRNQQLFAYLYEMTSLEIPGYGASFQDKWNEDHVQILTEIFDYIRSANLRDMVKVQTGKPRYADDGAVLPIEIPTFRTIKGQTIPSDTRGFGRFYTLNEVGLHFIRTKNATTGEEGLRGAFLLEVNSPSVGFHVLGNSANFKARVTGLQQIDASGTNMEFPADATLVINGIGGSWHGRNWGGGSGVRTTILNKGNGYPFLSKIKPLPASPTMSIRGGTITIELIYGTTVLQTFAINLDSLTVPVPQLVSTGTDGFRGVGVTDATWWQDFTRYTATTATPHVPGAEYTSASRRWPATTGASGFKAGSVFREEDTVRTWTINRGDTRMVAARKTISLSDQLFTATPIENASRGVAHLFSEPAGPQLLYGFANEPGVSTPSWSQSRTPYMQLTDADYHYSKLPDVPAGTGLFNKWGDWDNGVAQIPDGAYINKPDEGNVAYRGAYAYFTWNYAQPSYELFSPNRLLPGPGMFGSLPTGIKRNRPWETLLFRPQEGHPGNETPPDYLVMDLFWMPVVEPYAMSESFCASGKINPNYRMMPFSHIHRSTALRGVFQSVLPAAFPNSAARGHKLWDHDTSDHPWLPNDGNNMDAVSRTEWNKLANGTTVVRKAIEAGGASWESSEGTLKQFEDLFDSGKIMRHAAEICDFHLVRKGESLSSYKTSAVDPNKGVEVSQFWNNHVLTGENTRERAYSDLYTRLNTKSNTYTVHYRIQALQKSRSSDPAKWEEGRDAVLTDQRGQTTIERFIDTSGARDYATTPDPITARPLDELIRFRLVNQRSFQP
jgi:uncharacterized protein (TIGR02600 family)